MISFIQKHWKKFILALCALFWSGCGDDSSNEPNNEPVACTLQQLCTEYGIIYICDGVEMYGQTPDNPENCTIKSPPCQKNYICDDGIVCTETQANNVKKFDCKEGTTFFSGDKATATYNESEFNSKYYVKENN